MGLFGGSFGISSTKTSSTDVLNKTETGNQTGSQSTNQNSTGTQNQNTSSNSSSAGTSSTGTTGKEATSSTTNQATQQTGSAFTSDVLDTLTNLLKGSASSGAGGQASTFLTGLLGQLSGFNANDFVSNTVAAAKDGVQSSVDSAIGASDSRIGGTSDTNSMAALLDSRIKNSGAATIAGVQADAEAKAQGIVQGNAAAVQNSVNSNQGFLATLADALKGGVTTQTGQAATTAAGSTATSGTSATSTAESNQSSTSSNTVSTEQLASIIDSLLNTTSTTNATDKQTGKSTKIGGGLSIG